MRPPIVKIGTLEHGRSVIRLVVVVVVVADVNGTSVFARISGESAARAVIRLPMMIVKRQFIHVNHHRRLLPRRDDLLVVDDVRPESDPLIAVVARTRKLASIVDVDVVFEDRGVNHFAARRRRRRSRADARFFPGEILLRHFGTPSSNPPLPLKQLAAMTAFSASVFAERVHQQFPAVRLFARFLPQILFTTSQMIKL